MKGRIIALVAFAAAAFGLYALHATDVASLHMGASHSHWQVLAIVCAVLAVEQISVILIRVYVGWKGGPPGETKMLSGFVGVMAVLTILVSFLYSLGVLKEIGIVAAGFAGMLLGWSLQAPVSGVAAWVLVTLKRPFRVGDRVLFPSLGLNGDVKQVGLMYTVLDQVGGAIGSEDAIGRDILIPNAMLFTQVAINYTPRASAAFFLDEVVIRITYDSDWEAAEKVMLDAAQEVTSEIIKQTGAEPYIRSDIWDYGILMRLRYMTMAKDRPRITHEIIKLIFKSVQRNPRVDMAIPFVYSFRRSTTGPMRDQFPQPDGGIKEVPAGDIEQDAFLASMAKEMAGDGDDLVKNIREKGLLQPVIVSPTGTGRYRIVAGHKRFLACQTLGWPTIPVVIQPQAEATPWQA